VWGTQQDWSKRRVFLKSYLTQSKVQKAIKNRLLWRLKKNKEENIRISKLKKKLSKCGSGRSLINSFHIELTVS
jgi:phosphoheptose isomerase